MNSHLLIRNQSRDEMQFATEQQICGSWIQPQVIIKRFDV